MYSEPERHKPKVDRILFVIVESSSLTSKVLASLPIKSLEDKGVRVFILTVGKHLISSNQRTLRIGSFSDVSKLSYAFRGTGELSIHVSNESTLEDKNEEPMARRVYLWMTGQPKR